jgi:hypothetical protein
MKSDVIGTVRNLTSRPAIQLNAFLFDIKIGRYFGAVSGLETLTEKDEETFDFTPLTGDTSALDNWLRDIVGQDSVGCQNRIKGASTSYIAVLYRDIDFRLYLYIRPYAISKQGKMQQLVGYSARITDGIDYSAKSGASQ